MSGRPLSAACRNILLAGLMVMAAAAAAVLRDAAPAPSGPAIDLVQLVPERFSGWRLDADAAINPIQPADAAAPGIYVQTLERVYRGPDGARIMFSLAYGSRQRGDRLQVHRPEFCYRAQGFAIRSITDEALALPGADLPVRRLLAERPGRSEPVSYWLTVGNQAVLPGLGHKFAQMRQLLSGQVPDGMLVRVSSIDPVARDAYRQHDRFISDLLAAVAASGRERLAGRPDANVTATRKPS